MIFSLVNEVTFSHALESEMCANSLYVIFQKECFVELGLNTGQLGIDDSTQVPPG